MLAIMPLAALSDRVGRRWVFLGGMIGMLPTAVVYFPLLDTGSIPLIVLALVLTGLTISAAYGAQAALFSELFPTRVRYTGASLGYQLGAILGGALAPFIASALYGATETPLAIAAYLVVLSLVGIASGRNGGRRAAAGARNRRRGGALDPDGLIGPQARARSAPCRASGPPRRQSVAEGGAATRGLPLTFQ